MDIIMDGTYSEVDEMVYWVDGVLPIIRTVLFQQTFDFLQFKQCLHGSEPVDVRVFK
jgi:hypothetical protein